ncbi:MAG: HEAT repeat domain-containing protein [Phycisphaerales bacterium]|nr:HEAT repeat domain-containing protein [Phycisphaerales bacterium]
MVLAVAARVLWLVPKAQRNGWLAAAPTMIVIGVMPRYGRGALNELYNRRIWKWQRRIAAWQASRMLGQDQGRATRIEMLDFILELDENAAVGETLLDWMGDADPALRGHAAWYSMGCNLAPVSEQEIRSRLIELTNDSSAGVRSGAARGLSRFAAGDREILDLMLAGLHDADGGVRAECAWGVGRFGKPVPAALVRLMELIVGGDPAAGAAAETLGSIGDQSVLPALFSGLQSGDWWLRNRSAASLITLAPESEAAAASLIELTSHSVPEVRGTAIAVLAAVLPTSLSQVNWRELIGDAATAMATLQVLELRPPVGAVVPILVTIAKHCPAELTVQHESDNAYFVSIQMMRRYPEHADEFVPVLVPLLDRDQPYIRQTSIETLTTFGRAAQPALPTLKRMLRDCRNPHEQALLKAAIGAIEGAPMDP